jgi:hypothetical protein
MKGCTIGEENHGFIGVAANRKAAKQWLVASDWVNHYSDIWCPDKNARWGGHNKTLEDLYGEDWKEQFLQFSDEQLENMGFYIHEVDLIQEEI